MKKSKKLNTKFNYKKALTYSFVGLATAGAGIVGAVNTDKIAEAKPISAPPATFVMTVDTTLGGEKNDSTFRFSVGKTKSEKYNIYCAIGDNGENVEAGEKTVREDGAGDFTCDYGKPGTYQIAVTGTNYNPANFENNPDAKKIKTIDRWGQKPIADAKYMFKNATNLDVVAEDTPIFRESASAYVPSTEGMFFNDKSLIGNNSFSKWDLSNVTSIASMFKGAEKFNQPIGDWDVSNVKYMNSVFSGASSFNQSINNWNVGNVETFGNLFNSATSFNQPLNDWNTGKAKYLDAVFNGATSFNQPLDKWNLNSTITTHDMFNGAKSFDQSLGSWDMSSVRYGNDSDKAFAKYIKSAENMLDNSGLSRDNYDATLIAWSKQKLGKNLTLGAKGLEYCKAKDARESLIKVQGLTIEGDKEDCSKPTTELANKETKKEEVPKKESKKSKLADTGSNLIAYASGLVASVSGLAVLAIRKLKK